MKIDHLRINNAELTHALKTGRGLLLATALSLALSGCSKEDSKQGPVETKDLTTMFDDYNQEDAILVDVKDINDLNLILCNNQCNSEIFNRTCEKFNEAGISISAAFPGDEILEQENSTIITMAGCIYDSEGVMILGQYNNELSNNSDILALGLSRGLKKNDVTVDGIRSGVSTLTSNGSTTRIPTATEAHLGLDSSFAAIALGTKIHPKEADKISDGIVEGVIRATYEIQKNPKADYLRRITPGDTLDGLALTMGVDSKRLVDANKNLRDDFIQVNDMVRHPDAYHREAFQSTNHFSTNAAKIK